MLQKEELKRDFNIEFNTLIEKAIEISRLKKSYRFDFPVLLLVLANFKRMFPSVNHSDYKISTDIERILVESINKSTSLSDLNSILEELMITKTCVNAINYYDRTNWSKVMIHVFSDIEKLVPGKYAGYSNVCPVDLALAIFRRMNEIDQEDKAIIEIFFDIPLVIKRIENYLETSTSTIDVFDETGLIKQEIFASDTYRIIINSLEYAGMLGYSNLKAVHLLWGIADNREGIGAKIITKSLPIEQTITLFQKKLEQIIKTKLNPQKKMLSTSRTSFSEDSVQILKSALKHSMENGNKAIDSKELMISLLENGDEILRKIIRGSLNLDCERLIENAKNFDEESKGKTLLPEYICECYEVTKKDGDQKDVEIIGRQKEVYEILKALYRKNKRNVIVYGDKGVGK